MDHRDRAAIDDLFDRLAEAGRRGPARDAEAEALIRDRIRRAPETAYYLAQTALMQEQALRAAEQRLQDYEQELEERDRAGSGRGGFLAGLFGGGGGGRPAGFGTVSVPRAGGGYAPAQGGFGGGGFGGGGLGGGGFLAGAAQTAMGVTGGILLGHALTDLFEGDGEGHAARAFDNGDVGGWGSDAGGGEGLFGAGGDPASDDLFGGGDDIGRDDG